MYLRLNTRFNPFTYDELVRPLADYGKAYKEVEDAYSTLSEQAEAFKSEVNQHRNSEAYKTHSRYSEDLNTIIDDFSQGMTGANRAKLLGMKKRYNTEIAPIAKAAERRSALAEEQRKVEAANPTMMWERKASDMSLDEFINNPNAGYGRSYSGAALTAQVSANAAALAKEFRNNPDKMREVVGGDFYEYVKQRGFSSEAVLAAIANSPNASPVLLGLVENAINSSGVKDWATPETLKKAYSLAREGLWSAVGQEETQLVQNWRKQQQLSQQFQASEAAKNRQHQIDMANEAKKPREIIVADGTSTGTYYDPTLGLITDKDGRVVAGADGNISKVGTGKGKGASSEDATATGAKPSDFRKVASTSDMVKLGYTPVRAVAKLDGTWRIGADGDDAQGVLFGSTRSKVISGWGNYDIATKKGSYVSPGPNNDWPGVPAEVKNKIAEYVQTLQPHQDIQLMRVKSRGDGSSGDNYDYIILVSN